MEASIPDVPDWKIQLTKSMTSDLEIIFKDLEDMREELEKQETHKTGSKEEGYKKGSESIIIIRIMYVKREHIGIGREREKHGLLYLGQEGRDEEVED